MAPTINLAGEDLDHVENVRNLGYFKNNQLKNSAYKPCRSVYITRKNIGKKQANKQTNASYL